MSDVSDMNALGEVAANQAEELEKMKKSNEELTVKVNNLEAKLLDLERLRDDDLVVGTGDKGEINLTPMATCGSPCSSPIHGSPGSPYGLKVPHIIITKRTRTHSMNERALRNPVGRGKVKHFSWSKGHGFIQDYHGGEDIFVHISDIEGDYVPRIGNEVTFRICPLPPEGKKFQATHVRIVNFSLDIHVKSDAPLGEEEKDSECSHNDHMQN